MWADQCAENIVRFLSIKNVEKFLEEKNIKTLKMMNDVVQISCQIIKIKGKDKY